MTWQQGGDGGRPELDSEVLSAGLSASATPSPAFSLFAQLDGLRNEQGGAFGGTTDSLLASLQPTWTLVRAGLSLQTYLAFNRVDREPVSALGGEASASQTETYRLTLSWTPPGVGRYLSLQGGGEWSRSRGPGVVEPRFTARYTAAVTLRWSASSTAAAGGGR